MPEATISPRRPRLVFYYEGLAVGGVSALMKDLARATTSRFETTVVCQDIPALLPWMAELRQNQVSVLPFRVNRRLGFAGLFNPGVRTLLRQCFRDADIVHFHQHTPFSCIPAIFLAHSIRGPRLVATEHYVSQLRYLRRRHLAAPLSLLREIRIAMLMRAKRRSLAYLDRIITVSQANARLFSEVFGTAQSSRVITIANGVDIARFSRKGSKSAAIPPGLPPQVKDSSVVTVVAGLNNQKGHSNLIRAIPAIVSEYPDVRFLFVGEGHLRAELEHMVNDYGIADHVLFTGERHDIPDILALTDLFVLPSLFEGMPMSVLEAMAAGKAVVATAVDGTAEVVVHKETGLLVPPGDSNQLANAIVLLLRDKSLRAAFGARGRERVHENYSFQVVGDQHLKVYEEWLQ